MPTPIEIKRHSLAHIMAAAVQKLWPHAQFGVGPTTEDGFYYDIDLGSVKISEADFKKIEDEMTKIIHSHADFVRETIPTDEAIEWSKKNNQTYKTKLLEDIKKHGTTVMKEIDEQEISKEGKVEEVSFYLTGNFKDLCRGPHIETTKELANTAFKLWKVAGAYWRGDEKNPMLTRLYGLAFDTKKDLESYLDLLKEAEKRDHRKLGRELDLFTFSDLVGAGLPLFTPRGQAMREAIVDKLWGISKKYGYDKVSIPHLAKIDLYETSGHAEKFREEFFYVHGAQSGHDFVMKPMNCPHHTQIYASKSRSYKELPVRLNETTMMYRDEKPGQLLGLSRVRSITIDDAHIFCTPEQIKEEVISIVKIIEEFYSSLGMWEKGKTFWVSLSVRDPKTPEKYLGDDRDWETAEKALQEISDELKLKAKRSEGEAAFYGPKLDFMFKDVLKREWQLATAQIDFAQPKRFGLEYIDSKGSKKTPVMVHRAISGSLERFMAIMIEHFAGAFPFWLAPVQVKILPVSDKFTDAAKKIRDTLFEKNIRVELDDRNESLSKKIRDGGLEKVPYLLVVGEKEVKSETIAVRSREKGDEGAIKLDEFISRVF